MKRKEFYKQMYEQIEKQQDDKFKMTETMNNKNIQVGTTIDFKNKKWVDGFFWGVSAGILTMFFIFMAGLL